MIHIGHTGDALPGYPNRTVRAISGVYSYADLGECELCGFVTTAGTVHECVPVEMLPDVRQRLIRALRAEIETQLPQNSYSLGDVEEIWGYEFGDYPASLDLGALADSVLRVER